MRHTALQRAQHAIGVTGGMATLQFFEQRRRPQARHGDEHRRQLGAPDLGERVLARAIAPRPVALARQHWRAVDPPSRAFAQTGAGRRRRLGVSLFT
jgi:hypothetical protein